MKSGNSFHVKKRRGLSSIVGALIFVVLMVSAFAVIGVALNSQTDIASTGRDVAAKDLEKLQEKFDLDTIRQGPGAGDFLQINMTNEGQNTAEMFTVIMTNKSDAGEPTQTIEIPSETSFLPVNDDESTNIVSTLDLKMDIPAPGDIEAYDFKVISSLGTVKTLSIECDGTSQVCGEVIPPAAPGTPNLSAQLFLDGPNGVNSKISTVIMFVQNTGTVPLEDVYPDREACSVPGSFPTVIEGGSPETIPGDFTCAAPNPTPAKDSGCGSALTGTNNNDGDGVCLEPGQTAIFKWDGVVSGDVGDEFTFCNSVSGQEYDDTPVGPTPLTCDTLDVINPNDCGGATCDGGGDGGATIILIDDLLIRPSLFMVIPSPFGQDAQVNPGSYEGVWGVNVVNPTEVSMEISKVTIVVYPPTANDNDSIIPSSGPSPSCDMTMISPTSNWSCPKENTILWQDLSSPILLPPRDAVEFLVSVEPGAPAAGTDIDALIVQANVFTTLGSFGKGEGYQSTMRSGDTPIVNVFLQSGSTPDRTDVHGVQNTGITEFVKSNFYVSIADMDDEDATYIEDGARFIINVPREWTEVAIIDDTGFAADTDPAPGDQRVVELGDGSTQITVFTAADLGGPTTTEDDVVTIAFEARPPCNDIATEDQPYIMYILADGKTGPPADSFPIGPLNEISLVVDYDPGLDRTTCVPPQANP